MDALPTFKALCDVPDVVGMALNQRAGAQHYFAPRLDLVAVRYFCCTLNEEARLEQLADIAVDTATAKQVLGQGPASVTCAER